MIPPDPPDSGVTMALIRSRIPFLIIRSTASSIGCKHRMNRRSFCQKTDPKNLLLNQIKQTIHINGPISVADYMQTVLTSPLSGYYMKKDVFGVQGDFITSPEISQMFSELIGIWIVHEWLISGKPKTLQVVELGPGRGTLSDDILRVFAKFQGIHDAVSLHLVEVSPKLSQMQEEKLTGDTKQNPSTNNKDNEHAVLSGSYKTALSKTGIPITWHTSISDIPKGVPTCFIANEFFDALPIHKIQKTTKGWREILIDVANDSSDQLRFVLSPTETPASQLFIEPDEKRDHVEVCTMGGVIVEEIVKRIDHSGGNALIVDYGHNGNKTDTFRAFKEHELHDVLKEPGSADLTADVDFSYLRKTIGDTALCYGPITQEKFLLNMGIEVRLEALMKKATKTQQKNLMSGYKMLVDPKSMGERFKFFSILPKPKNGETTRLPTGFFETEQK